MSTALTFYFEDIFTDYQTWRQIIETTEIVDYTKPEEEFFDKYCFDLLSRHYSHCNIRYDEPESFILEIVDVYQNKFKQFLKEKEMIDTIYKMSLNDILRVRESLTNMANNPNNEPNDPNEPLNFISAQSYMYENEGKLKGYLQALNNIPTMNIYKFFKAENKDEIGFDDLFMIVQPNFKFMYKQDKEI